MQVYLLDWIEIRHVGDCVAPHSCCHNSFIDHHCICLIFELGLLRDFFLLFLLLLWVTKFFDPRYGILRSLFIFNLAFPSMFMHEFVGWRSFHDLVIRWLLDLTLLPALRVLIFRWDRRLVREWVLHDEGPVALVQYWTRFCPVLHLDPLSSNHVDSTHIMIEGAEKVDLSACLHIFHWRAVLSLAGTCLDIVYRIARSWRQDL